MFPEGHPYSWQPIGYVEDLDRVDVNDLKAFFLRWYGPNNAVLTIGGDIDKAQTLEWIHKYFGSIPEGPSVEKAPKQPAVLPEDRYITLEDRIRQPMVVIGWPTTSYRGAEDQVVLDAMADAIGGGTNGLLYQKLIKTQKALDAGAFSDCNELACNFYVYAMGASTDKDGLKSLYNDLLATLDEFDKQGISDERLKQITGLSEAGAVFALQSVKGKVTQLAANETFYGQPDRIEQKLEQIRSVTSEEVSAAYKTFIEDKHKVTLSVVPRGRTDIAVKPATFVTPARTLPEYKKVTELILSCAVRLMTLIVVLCLRWQKGLRRKCLSCTKFTSTMAVSYWAPRPVKRQRLRSTSRCQRAVAMFLRAKKGLLASLLHDGRGHNNTYG